MPSAQQVINYLNQKYREDFSLRGYVGSTPLHPYQCWQVSAETTGHSFTVYEQNGHWTDNYAPSSRLNLLAQTMSAAALGRSPSPPGQIRFLTANLAKITMPGPRISQEYARMLLDISRQEKLQLLVEAPDGNFFLDNQGNVEHFSKNQPPLPNRLLSPWQIERLCNLVYLEELLILHSAGNLGFILTIIKKSGLCVLPGAMTIRQWGAVIDSVLADPLLCSLTIADFKDVTATTKEVLAGHRAVCFSDAFHHAYVVFRGTSGDEEWLDNAKGMILAETIQQKAAASYLPELKQKYAFQVMITAGHSKGGNKAKFCYFTLPHLVDYCISVDGQGFSAAFFDRYPDRPAEQLWDLAEQRDFVHCLGLPAGTTRFFRGWRGNPSPDLPYGYSLPFFHCPDALRQEHQAISLPLNRSPISDLISELFHFFLVDSKLSRQQRLDTAEGVVSLLMKSPAVSPEESAEALAVVFVLFFDLLDASADFIRKLEQVLIQEADVLHATLLAAAAAAKPDTEDDRPIAALTRTLFIKKLLLNPVSLLHFLSGIKDIHNLFKRLLETKKETLLVPLKYYLLEVERLMSLL